MCIRDRPICAQCARNVCASPVELRKLSNFVCTFSDVVLCCDLKHSNFVHTCCNTVWCCALKHITYMRAMCAQCARNVCASPVELGKLSNFVHTFSDVVLCCDFKHSNFVRTCCDTVLCCALKHITYMRAMCCLLYTSPSPRDGATSRMPSSA